MGVSVAASTIITAIYASDPPSQAFIAELAAYGVRAFPASWIPPSQVHPFGFFLAQVPTDKVADVLALREVKKMDTAESESSPLNNQAARLIRADAAWALGWTGAGVRVGVLDSGLDISFKGTELPGAITVCDYSNFPTLDTTVNNAATGHGTHVTGSILGRGSLSVSNTANGGGAYKGMAPNASLVFLKIGLDFSGGATDAAEIGAIIAAADSFHVNILNMSYGGWDDYHDGSNPVSQAIDYAYSKGVACFVAAGNSGASALHASGVAPASDTSDFIPVTVAGTGTAITLYFNLVWFDGLGTHNNLSLLYYDVQKNILNTAAQYGTTESSFGTESEYSSYYSPAPEQSGTYYVRIVNPSSSTQQFHIYESSHSGRVVFANPDPKYTITYPADANHAFTVSAYVSRTMWTGMDGLDHPSGQVINTIASFASRGPRVDGVLKPNITAPGSKIISLRDHDVYTSSTMNCVDNDGTTGGPANYYVMEGTSMASPICAGGAALLYQHAPVSTPQQIYDAIMVNGLADASTGSIPNPTWGFGKLDVSSAIKNIALPVELTRFSASLDAGTVVLSWHTASETNNYGFDIEKKEVTHDVSGNSLSDRSLWSKIGFTPGSGTSNAAHEYRFMDRHLSAGTSAYRLKQIDRDGNYAYSAVIEVLSSSGPTRCSLSQNYPNPFNPSTTVQFTVGAADRVRLRVFDLLGRTVAVLADRRMEPGSYSVEWNADAAPSGVYFCRLDAGSYVAVKKLLLQK